MSDTPRTDAAYTLSTGAGIYELFKESQDIERELNAANQRIMRLEEALDTLICVIGLTPIKSNREALQEAFDMARAVLKAKEDKQ